MMAIKKATPKTNQKSVVTENPDAIYVVSYSRFSSEMQKELSIEAQQDAIHKYCESHGYICLKDYADRGISGLVENRPEFQNMIRYAIEEKKIKKVIIHKLDRFSRHDAHTPYYINKLYDNGVQVESVTEYFDNSTSGKFVRRIIGATNTLQTDNLSDEVMKVLKLKAKRAEHTGGKPPYGYTILADKLFVKPREAEAVKLMFMMVDLGFSYQQIIDRLYENGYMSTSPDGKFRKATIKAMLQNEKYMGTYTYNKAPSKNTERKRTKQMAKRPEDIIRVEGGCPAIIDPALFQRIQERLKKRGRSSHGMKHYYPLSDNDLIFCQHCGKAMKGNFKKAGRKQTPYTTYVCNGHRDCGCPTKDIQTGYIEDFVLEYLHRVLFSEKVKPHLLKLLQETNGRITREEKSLIEIYEIEIKEKTRIIRNLKEVAKKQQVVPPEVAQDINKAQMERCALEEQIQLLKEKKKSKTYTMEDVNYLEGMFMSYLKTRDTMMTRQFLKGMIERVEIGEDDIEVVVNIA